MAEKTDIEISSQPIRVLYVVHDMQLAGTECVVADLARRNRESLISEVVCLDHEGPLAECLQREGVNVSCTHRRAGIDIRQIPRIARIIRRFRPDVIHCHQHSPFFYAMMASRFTSHRCVVFTEHGCCIDHPIRWMRQRVNRIMGRWVRAITAVCKHTEAFLVERERFPRNTIEVIYNGVDEARFRGAEQREALRRQWGVTSAQPVIVQVGTLRPIKDQATCIRALRAVVDRWPDAMLVLVGDGPERANLQALTATLKLDRNVRFLGQQSEIAEILSACDIFVSSSLSEAHSLSLLEAMAAGLAAIATDVGGNCETIIDGQSGWLVPSQDPNALARAIDNAIAEPAHRACVAANGHRRVLDEFTQRSMHRKYLNLYRRVCRREAAI
jgi:glycosyltransferase involved in cell wall biosynthesis